MTGYGEEGRLTEPPEGVLVGESVPRSPDYEEERIKDVMSMMKRRGEPYINMKETELRERAEETIERLEG